MVSHIPTKGQVLQRYYGWYANLGYTGMEAPMIVPVTMAVA